jgi:alkanesulfonate monooxygenase SsuD/methylene tetrahydromethanopterin reductase-like flavin-dependent oxidoreductase (luciferase family)
MMYFSAWANSAHPWSEVRAFVQSVENMGWDGFWYADHYMPNTPDGEPIGGNFHECFSVLSALAATTNKIRLGSLVTPTTVNHPALIANRAATIDQISNGRFVLGMGAGWQVNEHKAFGIELFGAKDRVDRFAEAIEIVASMLSQERTTFAGTHFTITNAPCEPKPVQNPLPILVGTGGVRMLRLTARFAQEWNTWGTPDVAGGVIATLRAACEKESRDFSTVRKSVQPLFFIVNDDSSAEKLRAVVPADRSVVGTTSQLVDAVGQYKDLGFDEICVPDFTMGQTPAERSDNYEKFWNEVAVHFR